jgi:uncharacterized damage-inducible protein DinB
MHISLPQQGEYAPYAISYISKVPEGMVLQTLVDNLMEMQQIVTPMSDAQLLHAYAPGKWTIKELMVHMMDCERIFAYRALRIGRGDTTPLPPFEENNYAPASRANSRSKQSLLDEYAAVRAATLTLLHSFGEEVYMNSTMVNGQNVSLRAVAYMIAGHECHHLQILKERYLPQQ